MRELFFMFLCFDAFIYCPLSFYFWPLTYDLDLVTYRGGSAGPGMFWLELEHFCCGTPGPHDLWGLHHVVCADTPYLVWKQNCTDIKHWNIDTPAPISTKFPSLPQAIMISLASIMWSVLINLIWFANGTERSSTDMKQINKKHHTLTIISFNVIYS